MKTKYFYHRHLLRVRDPGEVVIPPLPEPKHGGRIGDDWSTSGMCPALLVRDAGGVWILLSCTETIEIEEDEKPKKKGLGI